MKYLIIAILLAVTGTMVCAADNPTVENLSNSDGWINWDRQVLKAVGHGVIPGDIENPTQAALMARSAAIADAYRNLAMAVNGVRVTGSTYVKNFVTKSDEIRTKVQAFIRGAEIVSEKQLPDRSFEVIMQIPLVGNTSLLSNLGSEILPEKPASTPSDISPNAATGLIIDARGLGVKPAISPKIYDEDGNEVYGTLKVSSDYAIEVGIVAYPRSMDQALKSPRAGKSPLIVKALKCGRTSDTDIVIRNTDAARIREADSKGDILSRCQVSILLGTEVK